jgi:acyl carrier protein
MDPREKIKKYIEDNLILFDEEMDLSDEDNIFEKGVVNSLFAMKLLIYIESEFNITVLNHEMEISNFNSVNNIDNFIKRKISE